MFSIFLTTSFSLLVWIRIKVDFKYSIHLLYQINNVYIQVQALVHAGAALMSHGTWLDSTRVNVHSLISLVFFVLKIFLMAFTGFLKPIFVQHGVWVVLSLAVVLGALSRSVLVLVSL